MNSKETEMETDKGSKPEEEKADGAGIAEPPSPAQPEDAPAEEKPAGDEVENASEDSTDAAESESGEESPAAESDKSAEPPGQPDWKDRYARAMADFDNFRKRTARDREDLVKFAAADVIKAMLPAVDNLSLALDKAKDRSDDPFAVGVKLVYDGLVKALTDQGATPLDSVGEPFDANFHDALAQLPSPDVEEGVVMNEVKRGWLLHGKLLRPAQVVVSAGKGA
jgi:molecular chaperone GrpE